MKHNASISGPWINVFNSQRDVIASWILAIELVPDTVGHIRISTGPVFVAQCVQGPGKGLCNNGSPVITYTYIITADDGQLVRTTMTP